MMERPGSEAVKSRQDRSRKRALLELVMLVFVIFGIFFEGLKPFGLFLPNSARWLDEGPGIALRGRALAITSPWIDPSRFDTPSGLSLEVWLRADAREKNGIVDALTLYDGRLPALLSLGQARSTLHLRGRSSSPADGTSSWGLRKGGAFSPDRSQMIVITSGEEAGTLLYLDGKRTGQSEASSIQQITPGHRAQIILGAAADGRGQWSGEIYKIALYDRVLSAAEISELWSESDMKEGGEGHSKNDPVALYAMDQENGRGEPLSASDQAGDLKIPPTFIPVRRSDFLSPAPLIDGFDVKDISKNLLGFVPLGLLLLLVLRRVSNADIKWLVFFAITAGIASSFFVELTQAYIPSRHSSILDLALNSAGTVLGTGAACVLLRRAKRKAY
jgi:hypothetical protein